MFGISRGILSPAPEYLSLIGTLPFVGEISRTIAAGLWSLSAASFCQRQNGCVNDQTKAPSLHSKFLTSRSGCSRNMLKRQLQPKREITFELIAVIERPFGDFWVPAVFW